jgi:hypothetical protein
MGASIAFAADRTMFGGFIRLDDRALGLKGTGITHAPQPVYWVLPTRRTPPFPGSAAAAVDCDWYLTRASDPFYFKIIDASRAHSFFDSMAIPAKSGIY